MCLSGSFIILLLTLRGEGGGIDDWFRLHLKHYVVLSLIPLPPCSQIHNINTLINKSAGTLKIYF